MKAELNTDLFPIIDVGMYNSSISPEYVFDDSLINDDREENYIFFDPEYFWEKFDNDLYEKHVKKAAENFIFNLDFSDILTSLKIEVGEIYGPKFYNFTSDKIELTVEFKKNELLKKLKKDSENFDAFLRKNYSSRSGFISHTANNYKDWLEDFKAENEQAIGAGLTYLFKDHLEDYQYMFIDEVRTDCLYSEFADLENYDLEVEKCQKLARENYQNLTPKKFAKKFKDDFEELNKKALKDIFKIEAEKINGQTLKML